MPNRVQYPALVPRNFCADWCKANFKVTKNIVECIYNCNKISQWVGGVLPGASSDDLRRVLAGGMVPGTTKRQRRAIRKAYRQHPSCPPESPFRCRNGQCVDHWSQCPDAVV